MNEQLSYCQLVCLSMAPCLGAPLRVCLRPAQNLALRSMSAADLVAAWRRAEIEPKPHFVAFAAALADSRVKVRKAHVHSNAVLLRATVPLFRGKKGIGGVGKLQDAIKMYVEALKAIGVR